MLEVHSLVHRQKLLLAIVKPSDGRFHGSFDGTIYKLLLDLLPIGIPTGDDWTILSLLMPVNYRSENVCYAGGVPIKGATSNATATTTETGNRSAKREGGFASKSSQCRPKTKLGPKRGVRAESKVL